MDSTALLERAQDQLGRGQVDAAMDTLVNLLSAEPDHGDAHALLALCLVRRKRLHAAGLEAQRGLELQPESVFAHLAGAAVAYANRRFSVAEAHLQTAQSLDPESAAVELQLARLYDIWGRPAKAASHAERARELAPDDPDALALIGELARSRGDQALAMQLATQALELDPEHVDSLVLLGQCELSAGRTAQAREHAIWALQQDPEDPGALALLCAIKARESLLLGLWWRFQSFITAGGGTRTVVLLLCVYLIYRVIDILLEHHGHRQASQVLSYLWLGFCLYSWTAPAIFTNALRKEMQQVRLRKEF